MRCTRCRAYCNPFFVWGNYGREATCNLCGQRMECPTEYFCRLDDKGFRRDLDERPELKKGTVDYVAPRDYSDVLPSKPGVVFVVDASQRSVASGFFQSVASTLRSLVSFMQPGSTPIGLVVFDRRLHFFSIHPGAAEARQITVSDIEDPFVPCSVGELCVDSRCEALEGKFEALLDKLPELFAEPTPADQVAGGPALKTAVEMMASRGGGHVVMFHCAIPSLGVGALRTREDICLYGTEKENSLYAPQQPQFYDAIVSECINKGVAVSAFCAPEFGAYLDVATLSVVPARTGGEFVLMPGFNPLKDGEQLHYSVNRCVLQGSAFSCIFKLRCSYGLQVESMLATWDPEVLDATTFQLPRLSVDANIAFTLTHENRIEGQKHVYMQAACLHTDMNGRRLVRVQTLQLCVTTSLSNLFRYTDIDVVTQTLLKQVARDALTCNPGYKERLTKATVDMLHAYRINCASTTAAGQLILPEALKLLPLYAGAIRKFPCFRTGSDFRADEKVATWIRLLSMPLAQSSLIVYPRVFPVAPLPERAGRDTGVGDNVTLPATLAASHERIASDNIFLVDNGFNLVLYINSEVTSDLLMTTFGVDDPSLVAGALANLEEGQDNDADRILCIIEQIRRERSTLPWLPLSVVVAKSPEEVRFLASFTEDRTGNEMPYVDFLCHVHKLVQNKLD